MAAARGARQLAPPTKWSLATAAPKSTFLTFPYRPCWVASHHRTNDPLLSSAKTHFKKSRLIRTVCCKSSRDPTTATSTILSMNVLSPLIRPSSLYCKTPIVNFLLDILSRKRQNLPVWHCSRRTAERSLGVSLSGQNSHLQVWRGFSSCWCICETRESKFFLSVDQIFGRFHEELQSWADHWDNEDPEIDTKVQFLDESNVAISIAGCITFIWNFTIKNIRESVRYFQYTDGYFVHRTGDEFLSTCNNSVMAFKLRELQSNTLFSIWRKNKVHHGTKLVVIAHKRFLVPSAGKKEVIGPHHYRLIEGSFVRVYAYLLAEPVSWAYARKDLLRFVLDMERFCFESGLFLVVDIVANRNICFWMNHYTARWHCFLLMYIVHYCVIWFVSWITF